MIVLKINNCKGLIFENPEPAAAEAPLPHDLEPTPPRRNQPSTSKTQSHTTPIRTTPRRTTPTKQRKSILTFWLPVPSYRRCSENYFRKSSGS